MNIQRYKLFWKPTLLEHKLYHLEIITEIIEEAINRKDELLSYEEDYFIAIEGDIPDEVYDGNWEIRNLLPNDLYAGVFCSYYSVIEVELLRICKIIDNDQLLNGIKDNGIKKANKYFKNVACIDFNVINKWNIICGYNKLRNHILHQGLGVNNNNTYLMKFITSQNCISIDNLNMISFSGQFLPEVNLTIKEFFMTLQQAIDYKYP